MKALIPAVNVVFLVVYGIVEVAVSALYAVAFVRRYTSVVAGYTLHVAHLCLPSAQFAGFLAGELPMAHALSDAFILPHSRGAVLFCLRIGNAGREYET